MSARLSVVPLLALCFAVSCSRGGQDQAPADQAQAPAAAPAATPEQPATPAPDTASQPSTVPSTESAAPTETPSSPAARPSPANSRPTGRPASQAVAPQPDATPAEAAEPAPAPRPQFREVTIPAGTTLTVTLATTVASDTSQIEDEVRGTLARRIVIDGLTAVPAGAEIVGTVREAKRSGRVKGRAAVAFEFERLMVRDETQSIRTAMVTREAEADKKDDVKKGAIGGGVGAIVGGIVGGGKGAAIGAAAGGAGTILTTRGDEVRLPPGTRVTTTLRAPLTVIVPLSN
jgi:hypothetical protein